MAQALTSVQHVVHVPHDLLRAQRVGLPALAHERPHLARAARRPEQPVAVLVTLFTIYIAPLIFTLNFT